MPVRTVVVEEAAQAAGSSSTVLNASGYVTARRQATVSSKVTGKVVDVLVEEGMKVEKDQILARLDREPGAPGAGALAEAQLEATRRAIDGDRGAPAEASIRKSAHRRSRSTAGVASKADWDAIEAEVDVFEAQLATQREQVHAGEREVDIAAAVPGRHDHPRAVRRRGGLEERAARRDHLARCRPGGGFTRTGISTIVDMSSLEIEVDVNEAYIQRVQPGQKVEATLDAYRDWSIPAHVITTIPAADRQKATVTVRIGFDQLDPRILPDMGIKVAFLATRRRRRDASARRPRSPRDGARARKATSSCSWWPDETARAPRGQAGSGVATTRSRSLAGLSAGERVVSRDRPSSPRASRSPSGHDESMRR